MNYPVRGVGLGLRRGMFSRLAEHAAELDAAVDFMEVAPENWIGVGGRFGRLFRGYAERFPLVCHGLSLSLGSPAPLDVDLLRNIKLFLDEFDVRCYTEHLSYCSDDGHLYDLMPIPFTSEAVEYVAGRIRRTQEILERRIAVEHVSYYAAPGQEMSELEFVGAVIDRADCDLLLDVNNIYVNSINFGYDPDEFLDGLPGERAVYIHIAGHSTFDARGAPSRSPAEGSPLARGAPSRSPAEGSPLARGAPSRSPAEGSPEDLRIDTHGAAVIEPVWNLLDRAYANFGVIPTLLERDFNFPPMSELLSEVERIRSIQDAARSKASAAATGV